MSKSRRFNTPFYGFLVLSGWHGTSAMRVVIVGETPKRFRIKAITRTRLPGRGRYLEIGTEALVPRTAVRVEATSQLPPETFLGIWPTPKS